MGLVDPLVDVRNDIGVLILEEKGLDFLLGHLQTLGDGCLILGAELYTIQWITNTIQVSGLAKASQQYKERRKSRLKPSRGSS